MRGATKLMKLKTRFEREQAAKALVAKGEQPNVIAKVTGCSLIWIEQLVRRAGGSPVKFEVGT